MMRVFSLALVLSFVAIAAMAAQPRFLEAYGAWDTYAYTENGSKVCYMASRPTKDEGNYSRRGEIFAYITHLPGQDQRDVFSYVTGYPYKAGSQAEITIMGQKIPLLTQDDKAWTLDPAIDGKLAGFIQKGNNMIVRGTSSRGTKTKDTFSLKGSGKAYARITKECGL